MFGLNIAQKSEQEKKNVYYHGDKWINIRNAPNIRNK